MNEIIETLRRGELPRIPGLFLYTNKCYYTVQHKKLAIATNYGVVQFWKDNCPKELYDAVDLEETKTMCWYYKIMEVVKP